MTVAPPRLDRALARAVREPLIHFLLIGVALYAGENVLGGGRGEIDGTEIRIDAAQLDDFRRDWALRHGGRPPDAATLAAAARSWADDEMLFREALRLGLERSDPVVRSRLIANMRFAESAALGPPSSDAARLRVAYALGMDRQDYVVRARLIEVMRRRFERGVSVNTSDARRYLTQHPNFGATTDWSYRFTQIFFSADRRGAAAERDARAALEALRSETGGPEDGGDVFLLGRSFTGTRRQIADRFGSDVAVAVAQAPLGRWCGPARSTYGWHVLRVEAVNRPQANPMLALRRAYDAALEERRKQALAQGLRALRERYPVIVDELKPATASVAAAGER